MARPDGQPPASQVGLLCSADIFSQLLDILDARAELRRTWAERVQSVFVYAGQDTVATQTLLRRVVDDPTAAVIAGDHPSQWTVSAHWPDFCGPMSGLSVAAGQSHDGTTFVFHSTVAHEAIISTDQRVGFFRSDCHGVPLFFSAASSIVDLDSPITATNFDVREHFLPSVPLVLYVKWAFADSCWRAPDPQACLVIDDPLLRPRYGFLRYSELLDAMRRHNFTTNIAFIPWNWRRSRSPVVRMFEENPERYSLSTHGCDHTGSEFGTRDESLLAWKVKRASDRMSWHESRTGIRHDHIMVFPQGVFSDAAMDTLKRANLVAAVNTEVISADSGTPAIRTSDVWDVAVRTYHNFPLFTRRYPSQGIENFAFDIILGKPCIVVAHHDVCRDRYRHLTEFIQRLNALNCRLSWQSLGSVVRSACRQREQSTDGVEVEMYASELIVTNRSKQRRHYVIRKHESDPSVVEQVRVDSRPVAWKFDHGELRIDLDLNPAEQVLLCVRFREVERRWDRSPESLGYKVKTLLRRAASEARDNYVTRISLPFRS